MHHVDAILERLLFKNTEYDHIVLVVLCFYTFVGLKKKPIYKVHIEKLHIILLSC
jgi:hypothetical protein